MLYFSRFKVTAILAVCALGILLSMPNLVSRADLPSWLQDRRVQLGLDLQGGSYLLLQIDTAAMVRERMETAADTIRTNLRRANIGYTDLATEGRTIRLTLRDAAQIGAVREQLADLIGVPGAAVTGGPAGDFTLAADGPALTLTLSEQGLNNRAGQAIEQSIEIVRRRIDETGVNEPVIARQGTNRILVQLPGVDNPERIKALLGTTAKMTFHLLADTAVSEGSAAPPGTAWLRTANPRAGEAERYLVRRRIEVDGASLTDAKPSLNNQTGEWVVSFSFDSAGARRFAEVTRNNVGKPFAIVLDEKVITAPRINEPITGGSGQISGNFTAQSANDLAVLLRAGALPAPLTIVEERTVGPDLGADAIRAGLYSIIVGTILVFGYMIVTYGLFGLFADIALIFNLFLTVACLSLLGATLTLPGIAGILLTLGMSVDANILINERIREETRKGRTPFAAIEAGFNKAFNTIVDANLTTLIKMALLFALGTGAVRGFAVTISLGIITSMFTATVLVRLMVATWLRRSRPKLLPV
ncbi:MAG TPA: protein translocase subunit SecD [Alphaproteobacteria bacterium]|nr:protein translocase subunit SecD [Alphaproteobacteria bacterium]